MKTAGKSATPPRMSDAAVQAKTGKTWKEWFAVLDHAGARTMSHKDIAAYLYRELKGPGLDSPWRFEVMKWARPVASS